MNLLLMTLGSAGDVHPMIAVGTAMRARGHDVGLLANPHFQPLIEREGLRFHALGTVEQYEQSMRNPDLWHPRKGLETVARDAMIPAIPVAYELASRFDPADTLIAASGLMFGARIAQEKLGFRLVSVHLQPVVFRSVFETPVFPGLRGLRAMPRWLKRAAFGAIDRWAVDPVIAPAINAFRTQVGLPAVRSIFGRWYHSPDRVIGLFPDWFGAAQPDWPANTELTGFVRYDRAGSEALPREAEAFLAAGEAPIVFTAGTANLHAREFFAVSLAAAERLGRRALLLTGYAEQLPAPLPPFALHLRYAPFSTLLPRAAAIVSHGGIGTVAQALAAGVPQLIVPLSHDQPDNGARIEALGVGRSIDVKRHTVAAATAALQDLLGSTPVRQACLARARLVDFDAALARTCDVLESSTNPR